MSVATHQTMGCLADISSAVRARAVLASEAEGFEPDMAIALAVTSFQCQPLNRFMPTGRFECQPLIGFFLVHPLVN